jgi:ribonuclease P protein component
MTDPTVDPSPADQRLRAGERLGGRDSFKRVFDAKRSAGGRLLVLFGAMNGLPFSRIGISIGRRFGHSPRRSRFKRLCREAFRRRKSELPIGWDLVVVPKLPKGSKDPAPAQDPKLPRDDVERELLELGRRLLASQSPRRPPTRSNPTEPGSHE